MLRQLLLLVGLVLAVAFGGDGFGSAPCAADQALAGRSEAQGCDCCGEEDDCCASGAACLCVHGNSAVAQDTVRAATERSPIVLPAVWSLDIEPGAPERGSPPPTPPPIG